MAKKGNTSTMDDVDRLFQCFKCGISPPQSAVRERKRCKRKLNRENSTRKVSLSPSLGSSEQGKENAISAELSVEKCVSTAIKAGKLSRRKQISPVIFYGSPHGVPPKRPQSLLRLLREIRIDLSEQEKSNLRTEVWATFPRQDEAVKFAKAHANAHVFSYQDHYSGQRRYLASTYEEFWKRYKIMESKLRHHYEVIQEGLPCHLYFDLEFNKRDNLGRDGDEMVDLLISVILEALLEKYSINGNQDWVVELDSSTEDKFSRHLIMRIPKTAFKDNLHVGAFVKEICSRIASSKERDERFEKLFVKKDSTSAESPGQLFVDTAVYSRNRCFRLALSSKAGKTSFLLPTERFKCKDMGEEDMIMASLICNMDIDCEKLLVCKMELDCVKTLHFETEVTSNFGKYCKALQEKTHISDVSTTCLTGKSPFPSLDEFIESIASTGKIRSWYWFSEYGLVVYSMSRNRYCERIGREHKSNHVMYVVDMRRAAYYQKCYDPDCKGYRSPLRPIPMDCIPGPSFFFDSRQIVDDDGLIRNNLECQVINDEERGLLYSNESDLDNCTKDSWWLEAIKVADNIESKPERLMLNDVENVNDEDDDWWMAAERTATQVELRTSANLRIETDYL
ncbi:DNA-directed primase/polymerase protein isoform X2 [Durio zibethinus]|uniref:DNA-directed primase/polymerase protein n=1 Tax=Durio zibethinus TaxID=66656 RepID=A0A6P5Y7J5_DURZI|nr:DNA-directed primase/polymerase protein isoform X2 [Durio zibethinus]